MSKNNGSPFVLGLVIIGLIALAIVVNIQPGHETHPVPSDSTFVDSLAILNAKVDSMEADAATRLANLDHIRKTQLINQRNYYENKIRHISTLPADSSLLFFTAHTSGSWRHRGSGSD